MATGAGGGSLARTRGSVDMSAKGVGADLYREASSISIQGMTGTPASAKVSQGGSGRASEKNDVVRGKMCTAGERAAKSARCGRTRL